MKKVIFFVIAFSIIAITTTGILIKSKNNYNVKDEEKDDKNITQILNEKTIDLYGTYDENDLKILEKNEMIDSLGRELKIPYIEGLKNKDVENKVNNDIRNRVIDAVNQFVMKHKNAVNRDNIKISFSMYPGFSNTVSIGVKLFTSPYDSELKDSVWLNYELVNGERLKFEDLFIRDADLYSIVRKVFYSRISIDFAWIDACAVTYYDPKSEMWKVGSSSEGEEYVPYLSEYDISKAIQSFMNNRDNFEFDPEFLCLSANGYDFKIRLKDIADKVVIYDKYVTDESLYEYSDIGMKNQWTCVQGYNSNGSYEDYGFAEDNLYYHVEFSNWYHDENNDIDGFVRNIREEDINEFKLQIEEYKKRARENKDKFFILHIESELGRVFYYLRGENEKIDYKLYKHLVSMDIEHKEKVMEDLIENYRFYSDSIYKTDHIFSNYFINGTTNDENEIYVECERDEELRLYNAQTKKEIFLEDIFKSGVDYMSILKDKTSAEIKREEPDISEEEISKILDEVKFYLDVNFIRVIKPKNIYPIAYFDYDEFDKSILRSFDSDEYIIDDSNVRNIEKSEIQDLTLDELNIAYNEIFARYGHEFKTQKFKEHFETCSWYAPIENKVVSLDELNDYEKHNIKIIKEVIDERN